MVMGGFIDSKRNWEPVFFDEPKRSMGSNPAPPMIELYPEMLSAVPPLSKEGGSPSESRAPPLSRCPLFMRLGSFHRPAGGPKPWILVTKSEILDKSKRDALGKLFTVLQTTWFIVQYLERWAAPQPRTQLEVVTLAFATLNILIYLLWWNKPLNVQEPIDVRRRPSAPRDDEIVQPAQHVLASAPHNKTRPDRARLMLADAFASLIDDDVSEWILITVIPAVGILFGGIHCFAWDFPFPTVQEKVLWRVSAAYCTASPFVVLPLHYTVKVTTRDAPENEVGHVGIGRLVKPIKNVFNLDIRELRDFKVAFVFLICGIYGACRVILAVLTFTCFRALPAGIYEATSWTSFFPHFG
jgi:hypothetical protein